MDLTHIATHTGLPARQVRYLVEHDLPPGVQRACRGRGTTREFEAPDALGLACAGLLRAAGLRGPVVKESLQLLSLLALPELPQETDAPNSGPVMLEIGDGLHVRVSMTPAEAEAHRDDQISPDASAAPFDTGWRQVTTGERLPERYEPLVVTRLDLGALRRRLRS